MCSVLCQACALTGNPTSDPLVHRPALNPLNHTNQGCFQFLCKPRSRVAGIYGNFIFNFPRNHRTVFRRGCTVFLPAVHVFQFLHVFANTCSVYLFILIIATTCISLMIVTDIEHLSMSLSALYISSLEKCLFKSLAHFLIRCFHCC